jgi:hypothetical protein
MAYNAQEILNRFFPQPDLAAIEWLTRDLRARSFNIWAGQHRISAGATWWRVHVC